MKTQTASQVIKSIKAAPKSWTQFSINKERLIMTNNNGWFFINYSNNNGFRIVSLENNVDMVYNESDVVAQQLWGYLFDAMFK